MVRGEPVDILLYWMNPVPTNAGSEQDGWYQAGERWVQVAEEARNLIPDGGFEVGISNSRYGVHSNDFSRLSRVTSD